MRLNRRLRYGESRARAPIARFHRRPCDLRRPLGFAMRAAAQKRVAGDGRGGTIRGSCYVT